MLFSGCKRDLYLQIGTFFRLRLALQLHGFQVPLSESVCFVCIAENLLTSVSSRATALGRLPSLPLQFDNNSILLAHRMLLAKRWDSAVRMLANHLGMSSVDLGRCPDVVVRYLLPVLLQRRELRQGSRNLWLAQGAEFDLSCQGRTALTYRPWITLKSLNLDSLLRTRQGSSMGPGRRLSARKLRRRPINQDVDFRICVFNSMACMGCAHFAGSIGVVIIRRHLPLFLPHLLVLLIFIQTRDVFQEP